MTDDHPLEDRLRDAFAARADLVTPESLRRESPPPPAVRRLPRWVLPGVTGLAVAATAAGVLVVAAPARNVAQPARPSPASSPAVSPSPSPTPAPRTTPKPSGSATATAVPVPPPATRTSVPALAQVVKASGWTVRVPSTWRARPAGAVTSADVSCVGTDEQPCLLRLAAGLDASAPPRFGVLGGGVLPGFSAGGCRQAGRGSELDVGDDTAPLFGWTCGSERYEQVTLQPRMLLAVARTGGGPIAPAVLRTLRRDPTYVHDYVVNACPDVPFGANGDGLASDVRAGGQICAGAASLVLELHTLTGPASGPAAVSRRGWRCSVVRTDGDLPSSAVTCRVADGMSVSWTQN